MGKVKDQTQPTTAPPLPTAPLPEPDAQIPLTEEEFNYVLNVSQARNNVNNEYNRVISAFLHYVAVSRGTYESTDNLQFELDFDDGERILKAWKLEDNFFNPEGEDKEN